MIAPVFYGRELPATGIRSYGLVTACGTVEVSVVYGDRTEEGLIRWGGRIRVNRTTVALRDEFATAQDAANWLEFELNRIGTAMLPLFAEEPT